MLDQQVKQGDDPAFLQQHIRRHVIGADGDLRGEVRQRFQRRDDIRQQIGVRAADLDRQSGAQFFQRVVRRGQFMIGGDAGGEVGLQVSAAQAAGVAFNQFAAVETGLDNLLHPLAAVQHAVHIHHFRHAAHFRPAEHGLHFRAGEIGAGHFEAGGGGDARRRGDHHLQRQVAAGVYRVAHALDAEDVGQLMRIPEHRGGALGEDDFGVALGWQMRAFEVHVGVHQAGRQVATGQGTHFMGVGAAAAGVDAGDHLADDTDVSGANFARGHIDDLRIDQQQIKRGFAARGLHGATADLSIAGHNHSGTRIMRIL